VATIIERPQESEAAPYYFTYINQVRGNDALHVIEAQLAEMSAFCAKISEEKSLYRYAPEKWSIRQVLNHLSDTERSCTFRAFWFARGFETALPSFDQNVAVAHANADQISWAAHVEEFRRVRLSTISLFTNMPREAWTRSGIASDNHFTVRALAYLTAGHATHHLKILRERYFVQ
jgi:uncharacterized damage-inducible protein DinB